MEHHLQCKRLPTVSAYRKCFALERAHGQLVTWLVFCESQLATPVIVA